MLSTVCYANSQVKKDKLIEIIDVSIILSGM